MKKSIFVFLFILFVISCYSTTYNTPVIDGTITIHTDDWDADENMGPPGDDDADQSWQFWLTWDATYLYLGFVGPDLFPSNNDEVRVYVDARIGGTTTGQLGEAFTMSADFCLKIRQKLDSCGYFLFNTSTDLWGAEQSILEADLAWDQSTDETEYRISWSILKDIDPNPGPGPFNIIAYNTNNNSTINAIWPYTENAGDLSCVFWSASGDIGIIPDSDLPIDCDPQDSGLPVILSTFTVEHTFNSAILRWTTQSETNNMGWNVYKAQVDELDEALQLNYALIPGFGNSSVLNEYSYEDLSDFNENTTYWYWLESISYAGFNEYYGPIPLTIYPDGPEIPELPPTTILLGNYPNPFNPETTIKFEIKENEVGILKIYNTKGDLIFKKDFSEGYHNFLWEASDLPSGIYICSLKSNNITERNKMILLK